MHLHQSKRVYCSQCQLEIVDLCDHIEIGQKGSKSIELVYEYIENMPQMQPKPRFRRTYIYCERIYLHFVTHVDYWIPETSMSMVNQFNFEMDQSVQNDSLYVLLLIQRIDTSKKGIILSASIFHTTFDQIQPQFPLHALCFVLSYFCYVYYIYTALINKA